MGGQRPEISPPREAIRTFRVVIENRVVTVLYKTGIQRFGMDQFVAVY